MDLSAKLCVIVLFVLGVALALVTFVPAPCADEMCGGKCSGPYMCQQGCVCSMGVCQGTWSGRSE